MLRPERMSHFRIIVPIEHELDLVDALAIFGEVHLSTHYAELSVSLPPILQKILERRITISQLNLDEALSTVKRFLREDDPLLSSLKEIKHRHDKLLLLKDFVTKLSEMGLSPKAFREVKVIKFDWFIVSNNILDNIATELNKQGILVHTLNLNREVSALLLAYERTKQNIVDNILSKFKIKRWEVPSWFYDDTNRVLSRLEYEIENLKKKAYDNLVEVAHLLQDAFEYERASRVGLLEESYKACQEIYQSIDKAISLLASLSALNLSERIIKENAFDLLMKFNVPRELATSITNFIKTYNNIDLLLNALDRIPPYENLKDKLKLLARELEELILLKDRLVSQKKAVICKLYSSTHEGSEALEILKNMIRSQVKPESKGIMGISLSERELLVVCDEEHIFSSLDNMAGKLGVQSIKIDKDNIDLVLRKLSSRINQVHAKIVNLVLFLAIRVEDPDVLQRLLHFLEDIKLKDLLRRASRIKMRKIVARTAPKRELHLVLKKIIDQKDNVLLKLEGALNSLKKSLELLSFDEALSRKNEYIAILDEYLTTAEFILSYEPIIEASLEAQSLIKELRIFREKRVVIAEGWVPRKYIREFEQTIRKRVSRIIYLRIREAKPEEAAPTALRVQGLLKYLTSLTLMRDVPNHWELDPTPLFTLLFIIMYGMMFGDIGLGIVIAALGFYLFKSRKRILGMSEEGVRTIGLLMTLCGFSATIFGILYGISFLMPISKPILPSPIHNTLEVIGIALLFGIIQLITALVMSVINYILEGNYTEAIFSGKGILGIIFYTCGVFLAYNIVKANYNLGIALSPSLMPITCTILATLVAIPLYSVVKAVVHHNLGEAMHGVMELVELIIEYPANTISYMRLAAFAMAHEAFGLLAHELAGMIGIIPSLLFSNLIVLVIEGFAVGIQSLRLLYYEFSTKFLRGGGTLYKPLRVSRMETSAILRQ